MAVFQLKRKQFLNTNIADAWDFFSSPRNLKVITPPYMGFDITCNVDERMYPGQIITYWVKPILGIRLEWVTEITHVEYRRYFVDEQRFGPYSFWHHKHFFQEVEGGIEMTDVVDYRLPFGFLGRVVHPFLVKPKLEEIFDYRYKKLEELFNKK